MTTGAQTWALIGLLGAFASLAMMMVILSFQSLRAAIEARFDAVDTRFDGVDRRLDNLDRDVQALTDRVFRDRP
jgi:hypothetical protein